MAIIAKKSDAKKVGLFLIPLPPQKFISGRKLD